MSLKKIILVNYIKMIGKAIVMSIALTTLALIIQTIAMFYTDITEAVLPVTSALIMTLSIALASIYASLKIKRKGWLNGIFIGAGYILAIVIISFVCLDDFVLNTYVFLKTAIALVTGAISGMIGVNLK